VARPVALHKRQSPDAFRHQPPVVILETATVREALDLMRLHCQRLRWWLRLYQQRYG
jgi:hypothetical protein